MASIILSGVAWILFGSQLHILLIVYTSTKIIFAGTFFFTGGSQYHGGASRKNSEGPTRKPPV